VLGRGKGREPRLSSLFPLPGIPRVLPFFPLPRPTAKKSLRSKQHERGLCGGESYHSDFGVFLVNAKL